MFICIVKEHAVDCTRNRNLETSKALLKSQAHQGTSLFTSAVQQRHDRMKFKLVHLNRAT